MVSFLTVNYKSLLCHCAVHEHPRTWHFLKCFLFSGIKKRIQKHIKRAAAASVWELHQLLPEGRQHLALRLRVLESPSLSPSWEQSPLHCQIGFLFPWIKVKELDSQELESNSNVPFVFTALTFVGTILIFWICGKKKFKLCIVFILIAAFCTKHSFKHCHGPGHTLWK